MLTAVPAIKKSVPVPGSTNLIEPVEIYKSLKEFVDFLNMFDGFKLDVSQFKFLDQYNEVGKNYMWGQMAKELLKSANIPSSYFSFFKKYIN